MGMYKLNVYDVYDENGEKIMEGTAREIADEFYTLPQAVRLAGQGKTDKYLRKYKVVKQPERCTQYISNCKGARSF